MFFVVEFAKFPWWERGIATPGPGFDNHLGQYDLKKNSDIRFSLEISNIKHRTKSNNIRKRTINHRVAF